MVCTRSRWVLVPHPSLRGTRHTTHTNLTQPPRPQKQHHSYSAAIKACERQKDWQTALRLLDDMRALGLEEPDDVTHGQLLHVLSSSGRWAEVGGVAGWVFLFVWILFRIRK